MAEYVESVLKAARIMRAFDPQHRVMTVREISARTEIPRSTCHALCATLVEARFLEAMPDAGYRLGPAVAWLGAQVFERIGLVEAATRTMENLSRHHQGDVQLGQYVAKGWIVYLHHVEYEGGLLRYRLGTRVPAHLTASGRAAMSRFEQVEVAEIMRLHAGADLDALLRDLTRTRDRGYAVTDGTGPQVRSVAAPILDAEGDVVGAVSLTQRRSVMNERRTLASASAVRSAAQEISQRLATRGLRP
ncbi:IclR family transcriptional regulator [Actinocorallia sp. A-T 12471]|uniref:IclR family transcriptional regulator n=1 Tax=Actinocorallia sp. A-T 12471 TaxID=3089813 RepID=UPI0029D3913F|nr:IclR family transcriptional regulator [Actinocorallia sp. A-T 12471]MDX6742773.1 IclR family transcriptional regulator [Actinocorallia sp. A-T 12471]